MDPQHLLRARLRDAADTHAVSAEVARFIEELGFPRGVVLLDERDAGVLTVEGTEGYAPSDDFRGFRLRTRDEAAVQLFRGGVHEATRVLHLLKLERAVSFPLRDAEGTLGLILAGGESWHESAPASLADVIPDVLMTLRHRILKRLLSEDRAILLNQQAEIEALVRELRKRNEEMLDDLQQAREFQAQMLSKPPQVDGIAVQVVYRPQDAVSGDLLDVSFDGSRIRVFVADTTGHGLRAGLATMLLKAEYESVKRSASPRSVLLELNGRIAETYRPGALTMTAVCVDLDPESGAVHYATAAHPGPIVMLADEVEELPGGGALIGVVRETEVMEGTATLAPGDAIYIYTDGVSEALSPAGELFGENRVLSAIRDSHADGNAARMLAKAAETFARENGFSDDVAIVSVRRENR